MNPTANERPGLNLPPPLGEQPGALVRPGEAAARPFEAALVQGQGDPTRLPPAPPVMPVFSPPTMPNGPAMTTPSAVPSTTLAVVPDTADDGDLIEKEWVEKAKRIVEQTRENPYQQSKELTVFKADYLQKRYNKSMKISEQ